MTKHHDRKRRVRELMALHGLTYQQALDLYRSGAPAPAHEPTTAEILRAAAADWASRAADTNPLDHGLEPPAGMRDAEVDSCALLADSLYFDDQPAPDHVSLYEVGFEVEVALRGWGWATSSALDELVNEHGALAVDRHDDLVHVVLAPRSANVVLHVRVDDGSDYAEDAALESATWAD